MFIPRNIFAKWRAKYVLADTASVCQATLGLRESLTVETCALVIAKDTTKEIV